uniref:GLPGLI family protein n=1 Tax=Mariniflexile sp. TaxID=1979402 RepID=UPI00404747D1
MIKLLFFLPLCFFAQEKKISDNVVFVDFTYSIQMEGAPSAFVVNSTLSANQYASLYEMDFLGNTNFQEEQDSEGGVILSIKAQNNGFIFKNFIEKSIYSTERVEMKTFLVKDSLNIFNWGIKPEFKNVLGYKCQKAIVYFRGRNYEAFFATDIPYQTGPWKFNGLPGLILEVSSIDGVFKLTANKLILKNMEANIENPFQKNIKKVITWEAFILEYKKRYNELLHYRGPGGSTQSIPKKGIETYIN